MADSYPEIDTDRDRLIENDRGRGRKWCCGHPRLGLFFFLLSFVLLGHGLAIYFIYFYNKSMALKVIALNTWGMPAKFGSEFKEDRMKAIGEYVAKGDYDVFLLEELWMQPDHETIASYIPEDFIMTGFRQLSLGTCDGRIAPSFCSGLAIISRHNFVEVEFDSFTYHGDPLKAAIDGEWLARKGIGRVRISPEGTNVTIDVFVTHTAADPDPSHGYNNSYYRVRQVKELMDSYISKSKADIVILGGDFNAEPEKTEGSPYQMIRQLMSNCIQEIFYKFDKWLDAKFATYGNFHNSFTGGGRQTPVTYDYIFHRTNSPNRTQAWTYWFDVLSNLRALVNLGKEKVSFSDHEAIESTIYFLK